MKEVKKCSLSGVAFTMDTDAYATLAEYLESLKNSYADSADGEEIVADIEARIAELILSAQDNTRVVERPLIRNIIEQMGSAADITQNNPGDARRGGPRIPRRLYRDPENARLGGVCSGIGKYFDIDPVWVRLSLFIPLIIACFGLLPPVPAWIPQIGGHLFGIFVICYLIMWFAVPVARTARQKLEMNGERITVDSIRETTRAAACDPDSRAKPIVANIVSVLGQLVLILLKILAGLLVFVLILAACSLIIALFALLVGGTNLPISPVSLHEMSLWASILGILIALAPIILLIYVLMCLIASRKPSGKSILAIFFIWVALILTGLIAPSVRGKLFQRLDSQEIIMIERETIIDGDTIRGFFPQP